MFPIAEIGGEGAYLGGGGLNTAFYSVFLMAIFCGVEKSKQTRARNK